MENNALTLTPGSTCRHCTYNEFNAVPNYHPFWEIVYMFQGTTTFNCGLHSEHLTPGDICIIAPFSLHLFTDSADNLDFMNLTLPAGFVDESLLPTNARYYSAPKMDYYPFLSESMRLFDSGKWMTAAHLNQARIHFSKIVEMMMLETITNHLIDFRCEEQSDDINQIFKFVSEHASEDLNMEMLSKKFYLSQSYLSKTFKRYTGTSPIEAIIRCRIHYATTLLVDGNTSIQEISAKCGYHNITAFTKLFTKRMGCPPSEYRRRHTAAHARQTIYGMSNLTEKLIHHDVLD